MIVDLFLEMYKMVMTEIVVGMMTIEEIINIIKMTNHTNGMKIKTSKFMTNYWPAGIEKGNGNKNNFGKITSTYIPNFSINAPH